MVPFSSFFHVIVPCFAVQRRPCWVGLGGGEEGLQKGDFGFDWVKTRYIIQGREGKECRIDFDLNIPFCENILTLRILF